MFYGTQTAQRDGDDGGGLGCPLVIPTITTVIATHTNIKFSTWFRNVCYDFTIGISRYPRTLSMDASTKSEDHVYEVRPRKDRRGGDLVSDALESFLIAG
jgi:hypothetical protein